MNDELVARLRGVISRLARQLKRHIDRRGTDPDAVLGTRAWSAAEERWPAELTSSRA